MKTYITLILAALFASSLNAATGDSTQEQFLSTQKAQAEAKGWGYDEVKLKKQFAAMDTNSDGVVSGDEKKAYWASLKAGKAPTTAKPAAKPLPKKAHAADQTKPEFVASQKTQYEKKGWSFDLTKAEALFDAIDANNDGMATGKEKKAYWDSRK